MSARKAYSGEIGAIERHYNERKGFIRMQLPTMPGYELQRRLNDLNEEIDDLRKENEEQEGWIHRIKRGEDVPAHLDHMHRTLNKHDLGMLELRVDGNKTALKWIRRERQIYVWEKTKRKMAAAKLPLLRQQLKGLNQKGYELLWKMKSSAEQLSQALAAYQKTYSEHYELNRELEKLSFEPEQVEGRIYVNMTVPAESKELKFFRELDVKEESKESKGLRKLLKTVKK